MTTSMLFSLFVWAVDALVLCHNFSLTVFGYDDSIPQLSIY